MKRLICVVLLTVSLPLLAQQEFELTLSTKALDLIEIGVAGFHTEGNMDGASAQQTLIRDLQLTGVFSVVPGRHMNLIPVVKDPTKPDCEQLLSVGAKVAVTVAITPYTEIGEVLFHGVVTDTKTCKTILSRRYRGEPGLLKKLVHSFADDIIYTFTGQRGITNSRIAFVSDATGNQEVYIMDYNGDNIRQLTKINSMTIFPAVSPDRQMIAFTSYYRGNPDLFLMTLGKGIETLYSAEGIGSTPDFSRDGKWMVFSASKEGNTDIYLLNLESRKMTRLTNHVAIDTSPRFSPNGKEIVFTSDRFGAPRIYAMDRDGLNVRKLGTIGNYNDSPVWSPDGRKIAYVAMFNNRFDIFVLDVGEQKNYRLTNGEGSSEYPAWSPDAKRIVFASNRNGSWQLYSMNINGTGLIQLTEAGNNTCPFWVM